MDEAQIDARLKKIRQQVMHMKDIMDDVLQMARIQAGHATYVPVEADLDALCQDILDEFQSRPGQIHVLNYTCTAQPTIARIDLRLMRQVINNLVSNAVKYS